MHTLIAVVLVSFALVSAAKEPPNPVIDSGAYKVDAQVGPSPGPHRVEIRWAKPTGKTSKNE